MDLAERDRLLAVTRGFQSLRGLIFVPLGLLVVAMSVAISVFHLNRENSAVQAVALFALFPCALAASVAAWVYYRRRFGVVQYQWRSWNTLLQMFTGIVLAAAAPVAVALDERPVSLYPVSFWCLWWALLYLACYLSPYRLRPHSLWFAAVFLGLCLLTLAGVAPRSQFSIGSTHAGDIFIWLAFSVHGLLDHLLLLRLLPKASPDHATAQAGEQHG
jgi:hypothetical protein